jgi:hypothetical protein
VKAKHLTQIVELDGLTLRRVANRLEQVKDPWDGQGPACLISDLQHSISRILTVDANIRYVELMVARMLQESGEFEEPVFVITHWKKKRAKNSTDIFFTALPSRIYFQYLDRIRQRTDCLLLYPLYAVLHQVLKGTRRNQAAAVIFQHGRCADVLVGTAQRVFLANRFVAYDTDPAQITGLWDTIRKEIATVASEKRIEIGQVIPLTWIDSLPVPAWPAEAKLPLSPPEAETLVFGDQSQPVSFLKAVEGQGVWRSISPAMEKTFYLCRRWAPRLQAAMLGAILMLAAVSLSYRHQLAGIQAELGGLEHSIAQGAKAGPPEISSDGLQASLDFLDQLDYSRSVPSFKHVVDDFSAALASDITIDTLKLDYAANEVRIESFGRISGPFEKAHRDFQDLLAGLAQKGYAIQEKHFDTQISASSFLLRLTKRIG